MELGASGGSPRKWGDGDTLLGVRVQRRGRIPTSGKKVEKPGDPAPYKAWGAIFVLRVVATQRQRKGFLAELEPHRRVSSGCGKTWFGWGRQVRKGAGRGLCSLFSSKCLCRKGAVRG